MTERDFKTRPRLFRLFECVYLNGNCGMGYNWNGRHLNGKNSGMGYN